VTVDRETRTAIFGVRPDSAVVLNSAYCGIALRVDGQQTDETVIAALRALAIRFGVVASLQDARDQANGGA
jgi:hypothetical protein